MRLFTRRLGSWGDYILNKSLQIITLFGGFKLPFNQFCCFICKLLTLHLAGLQLLGLSVNIKQSGCMQQQQPFRLTLYSSSLFWSCSSTRLSYICVCREQDNNSPDHVEEAHPHKRSSFVLLTKFAQVRKSLKGLCCLQS